MSMSINMHSGLNALLSINSELSNLQNQATTGKRVNSAADDLTAFISSKAYINRANSISDINTTLSNNLATINAAKSGADQIRKTVSDTLALLKDASQTQSYIAGTGGTENIAELGSTNVNLGVLTGVAGDMSTVINNFNINTALVGAPGAGFNLRIGGQTMKQGATYAVTVAGVRKQFRISATTDIVAADVSKVTTVGDLLSFLGSTGLTMPTTPAGSVNINNLTVQMNLSTSGGVKFEQVSKSTDGTATDLRNMFVTGRNKPAGAPTSWQADDVSGLSGLFTDGNQQFTITGNKHDLVGGVNGRAADIKRANAAAAYDAAMKTINQYLNDSSVSGSNLLNGEKIKVTFNEKGTSLDIQLLNSGTAMQLSAKGLGLVDPVTLASVDTGAKFANNYNAGDDAVAGPGLMSAIDKLTSALTTIDLASSQVNTFQNTVQDRKNFNGELIKLLNSSANDLTAADMTEVSTRAAALQVQQSFAQTMLANFKQSDQSVLQLLR